MSSNVNQLSCGAVFRVCLNSQREGPNPHSSPTSPSDLPIHNPTQTGNISQQPAAVAPMSLLRVPPNVQSVSKSLVGQSDAWGALGVALKTLETGVGVFPPLKAAVSELLVCTTRVQSAEQNRQEYDQLASNLVDLVTRLRSHFPDSKPERMPPSIENVARSISEQAAHIKRQQDRSGLAQVIQAANDEVDILGCYRRIEHVFRQLQSDITLSIWDLTRELRMDTLLKYLNSVDYAKYDAALSEGMEPHKGAVQKQRGGCTPNTRVKILKGAIDWTRSPDSTSIYWMNGMAGTGKTTIAYSLCERLEMSKQLGACFFCSRLFPECRDVNRMVTTIAYQLAQFSNPYKNELCEVLANNRDLAKRKISKQFEELIVGPLSKVRQAIPPDVVIVIDALDECTDVRSTQIVLELLFRNAPILPVKFFVTSRPEPDISNTVLSAEESYRLVVHLHDVEESFVKADIQTYLEHELAPTKIKPQEIERLTAQAARLFIYAATAIRYIEPYRPSVNHAKRLATIFSANPASGREVYRELDVLYATILMQAQQDAKGDEGQIQRLLLHTVIGAQEPLSTLTLATLSNLESEEMVEQALLPLGPVLRISEDAKVITTLHASFLDFMLDPTRSKDFHCDLTNQNTYTGTRCFEVMSKSLKFNICNLETSSQFDQDIPGLKQRANEAISSGLAYACRYWGDHFHGAKFSDALANLLDTFLRYQLLFWMEALNLKNWIGSAAAILLEVFNSLPESNSWTELRSMVQDSRNFATTYAASPASLSTPHIYISALPLVPNHGFIRKTYWSRTKGLVQIEGPALEDRSNAPLTTWATGSMIIKLALSRDGGRLISGAGNGTITIWNVTNGRRLLGPLQKHNDMVWSVAYSPDGSRVASGSVDSTINVSDADTGATLVGSLVGHTKAISYLIFSPDSTYLASASEDHTIRIWDSLTGAQIGTELRGHQGAVMGALFLSNGKHLTSCSDDRTIRVWDWRQGTVIYGPFEGHTDCVDCISLSPGDTHIASSSKDRTVRIWSIATGKTVVGPLEGHTGRVECLAFSPDGRRVASGSNDKTIRIWSSETGYLIAGPFRGHASDVNSVIFSPDGTRIISGSADCTICIWDASHSIIGKNPKLFGHTGAIPSVALSPDGTRVVSGSVDHTICVWDIHTGNLVLGPFTGHTGIVFSVAYTPDGSCIVSGSEDGTIRTWDAHTGSAIASPLAQYTDSVMAVAVSPDGRLLVSRSTDRSVKIWDLEASAELVNLPTRHTIWVMSVEFSPNGLYIASGSDDQSVCIWDVSSGSLVRRLEQHTHEVTSASFSPDSTKIVSCASDGTLIVWHVDTGTVLSGPWKGHEDPVRVVAFSPDGTMIASGSHDCTIRLWNAENGTMIAAPFRGHTAIVYSVAFTQDGKHIISSSEDHTIRVWDLGIKDHRQQQATDSLVLDEDGWLRDSESRIVFWIPSYLQRIMPIPPCSLLICSEGIPRPNPRDVTYGDDWADCYVFPCDSDTSRV